MNRREFMKNALTLASVAAFGLGRSEEVNARETSAPRSSSGNEGDKNMKCAVVYFSWGGNTRFAAETIAKKVRADIFEIKAETPYNSDFNKCCDEAKPECYGKKLRAIKPVEGLEGHDCAAGAHVDHTECRRAQGQDDVSLPDPWRRRNAEPRTRLCGASARLKGPRAQGVQRLVHQVQRQGARGFRRREDCRQVKSHAKSAKFAKRELSLADFANLA